MEKERLTNEKLRQKSKSQFDLVNYAIRMAEYFIKSGKEPQFHSGLKNPALQVLAEIASNKGQLEEIPELIIEVDEEEISPKHSVNGREQKENHSSYSKTGDRKKAKSRLDTW
jgi:hypothetical protein